MVLLLSDPRARSRRALLNGVSDPYLFSIRSSTGVFQDTGAVTPAGVGDPVRRANNLGSLGGNVQAPNDAARLVRSADGFVCATGDYFDLGSSTSLQPATLMLEFDIKRTGDMSGVDGAVIWAKANGDYTSNGWYFQINGPLNLLAFYTDGTTNFQWAIPANTAFPLNTTVRVRLTHDNSASPKTVLKFDGVTQTASATSSTTITATSDPKYFNFNSPGYGGGHLSNCTIENIKIHNAIPA